MLAITVPVKTMAGYVVLIGSLALWPRFIEARFAGLLDASTNCCASGWRRGKRMRRERTRRSSKAWMRTGIANRAPDRGLKERVWRGSARAGESKAETEGPRGG